MGSTINNFGATSHGKKSLKTFIPDAAKSARNIRTGNLNDRSHTKQQDYIDEREVRGLNVRTHQRDSGMQLLSGKFRIHFGIYRSSRAPTNLSEVDQVIKACSHKAAKPLQRRSEHNCNICNKAVAHYVSLVYYVECEWTIYELKFTIVSAYYKFKS